VRNIVRRKVKQTRSRNNFAPPPKQPSITCTVPKLLSVTSFLLTITVRAKKKELAWNLATIHYLLDVEKKTIGHRILFMYNIIIIIIMIITIIIVMRPELGVGIVLVLQRTGTDRWTYTLLLLIICFTTLANIFGWHGDSGVVVVKGWRVTECVGW